VLVEERNFAKFAGEFACDYFRKSHEAVSSADPGTEDEGVVAVEGDGWLDVDGSPRVRHVISGESPYLAR
jgi:hypothetical protein